MKRKIINIIAILALVASFVLPALAPQNAWADTVYEQYCASKGFRYSSGGCIKTGSFTKDWCEEQGGSFTPPSSSSKGEARCWIKITGSATIADTPSNDSNNNNGNNSNNSNNNESGGGGTSPTSGSSKSTNGATQSSPKDMNKTCKGENQVQTSILGGGGCVDIDQDGGNIFQILNTILTILTYGVGIAGTLGIVISGIQYLTAKDNEQQMVKAKSRLINIVIGLAAYAFMWAFLQWLIPGGLLSGSK